MTMTGKIAAKFGFSKYILQNLAVLYIFKFISSVPMKIWVSADEIFSNVCKFGMKNWLWNARYEHYLLSFQFT